MVASSDNLLTRVTIKSYSCPVFGCGLQLLSLFRKGYGKPALAVSVIFLVFPCLPFVCLPSLTALYGAASSASSSCSTLAPSGSLTLGSGHFIVNGNIQVIPISGVSGKLSLFRMWGRERSSKEVASMNCTEGDVVKWERDIWDTQMCAPLQDDTLNCSEHATYKPWILSLQTFAVIIWFYFTAVNVTFIKLFPASAIVCWLSLVYPLTLNTHHLSIWQLSKCKNKFIIN